MQTTFTRALNISHPIVQAPMGGANATPPALVAAASGAGALGFIGAAYMSPEEIAAHCRGVRERTPRPFGLNLFVPTAAPPLGTDATAAMERLLPYHAALGIDPPDAPRAPAFSFDDQLAAALEGGAAALSFTFGVPAPRVVDAVKERGLHLIGTATTVDEAVALEAAGVDAVVAQGSEAGAHRGTFAAPFEMAMIGTMALVPQVVDAVRVPVLASGGIMDGRGIAAALALGAAAVQMGTAFLVCDECGVAPSYKRAVLEARAEETRPTRAFSGRPARGIVNRAMSELDAAAVADAAAVLPYPHQNALTRPMRSAAARQDRPEFLSLWAGQGARLGRPLPAAELVRRLAEELDATVARLRRDAGQA